MSCFTYIEIHLVGEVLHSFIQISLCSNRDEMFNRAANERWYRAIVNGTDANFINMLPQDALDKADSRYRLVDTT